eukprot:TRINITY_DN30623_c0_g1_i1.p3 TRINITY_DN30623_c0_g1~~TRINITY_DN30623_c0_g1_i1.p3  ORF type:complete len:149 (+),score=28.50 TRINITY_DN30623_c0_g1_i1:57-503(+)
MARIQAALLVVFMTCGAAGGRTCRNTVQGVATVCDDTGRVCPAAAAAATAGCCPPAAARHTCGACDPIARCCAEFEACVSCCLSDELAPVRAEGLARRRHVLVFAPMDAERDPFRYCAARCRTGAASTVHQNRYKDGLRHCFAAALDD